MASTFIQIDGTTIEFNPGVVPQTSIRYVSKNGNDSTGNGSVDLPFLTIQAAENSITDATPSTPYVVMVGPGIYAEGNSTTFRDNIILKGSGRDATSITGAITYTYGGAAGTIHAIQDIKVAAITYSPPSIAAGLTRNTNFSGVIFNSYTGNIIINGDGTIKPNSPGIQVYESQIGSLTVNGGIANNIFRSSLTSGVTLTNVPFLSASNFLNSTVISRDTGAGTITTQTGLLYPASGATTGSLGGGRIRVWTGSSGPSLASSAGFERAQFTYTAYNSSTGVFSGITINSGTLAAITAGDVMTNEENSFVFVAHCRNSGTVTVTATGSNSQANGSFRGGIQGNATVSGANSLYTIDVTTTGNGATPVTYANSASPSYNLFYATSSRGISYTPATSANWPTALISTTGDVTINNKIISNVASTTGIFEGAQASGTGIPAGAVVTSLTATTVTINVNPTATNTTVSLSFQNVVPKSGQLAFDILARKKVDRAGDTMTGPLNITGSTDAVQLNVKANATQNANIQEWKDSGSTILSDISKDGKFQFFAESSLGSGPAVQLGTNNSPTKTFEADLSIDYNSNSARVLALRNILEEAWLWLESSGELFLGTTGEHSVSFWTKNSRRVAVGVEDASATLEVLGVADQTQNLQEWRDSDNNILANITATGDIFAQNLDGMNNGDITLTAVGSTPSADGASLSGQVLTLQPADATNPGVVTTDTQTIAGAKTFSGSTLIANDAASQATIGGASSTAVHVMNGGLTRTTRSVSSNLTIDTTTKDSIIFVDTSGGVVSITLPAPVDGRSFKLIDTTNSFGTNNLTIVRNGSEKINNFAGSKVLYGGGPIWDIITDGTNWWVG